MNNKKNRSAFVTGWETRWTYSDFWSGTKQAPQPRIFWGFLYAS